MPYQGMQGGRPSEVSARRAMVVSGLHGIGAAGQAGTAGVAVAGAGARTGALRR